MKTASSHEIDSFTCRWPPLFIPAGGTRCTHALECGWAPHEITDVHEESLDVVGVALAGQFEGPGAVQVISQGLAAVNTLEKSGALGNTFPLLRPWVLL